MTTITIIIIAFLAITTLVSTSAALTMWAPDFIPSLIVHGVLAGIFSPLFFAIANIPFGINHVRHELRLSRLHLLAAIFSFVVFCSGTGLPWVASRIPPSSYWHGTFEQGFSLRQIPTWYGALFHYVKGTELFWHYFLPALAFQTVFDMAKFIYDDFFILFKDLGVGGSGTTFYGWAVGRMRYYAANADVLTPPRVPQTASPWRGRLDVLPQRVGPRPSILGCTPQRQVDFPCPPNTPLALERLYDEFVTTADNATQDHITVCTSYLEPGLTALRRTVQGPTNSRGGPLDPKTVELNSRDNYGGEIWHNHREGTAHVILHEDDIKRVIEAGWAERHPFCASGFRLFLFKAYYNWFRCVNMPVPPNLVITYAPRHIGEYEVLRQIMRAAVWHATEGRLYALEADTYPIPPAPAPEST
ncbi:hypothetical protein NPX13_g416 [Xylaria arbuscula]|uniref:Luciferase domain-containing protein n=1 Tax=Xylaria arbuscula TaxID=114810 RepID=A0A9W8NP96_9PEZI|nr:hypothetical protein NPX13_g416 [Xylaria arbuscula]